MERSDVLKLRALPIESVAERLGLRVVRHKCLCPFHDDSHPSLSFSVSRNTFKCFVCDSHGGVIDLAMKVLGRNFVDTCHWLADSSNIILEEWKPTEKSLTSHPSPFNPERYAKYFEHPFLNEVAKKFLFDQRHLDTRVVRWCRLTSWRDKQGINWLQIPYFDTEGRLIGVQSRNLDYSKPSLTSHPSPLTSPRFRFPQSSTCHIYNLPVLKMLKSAEPLYIAEGCSDCWSLLSSGHKAIAIPSATLLNHKDLELLSTLHSQLSTEFHMYPDQDVPGERLFLQLQSMLESQLPSLQGAHPLNVNVLATKRGLSRQRSAEGLIGERLLTRHPLPSDCKDFSEFYMRQKSLTSHP